MIAGVADTHAVIWYLGRDPKLSVRARDFMDLADAQGDEIGISSIGLVELIYLEEKRRIPAGNLDRLFIVLEDRSTIFVEVPVDREIVRAVQQIPFASVPDMPDRIIAATALHLNVPLISRDREIRLSGMETIW
jgi:PIN domain nuclease of toxin-antitoxin system